MKNEFLIKEDLVKIFVKRRNGQIMEILCDKDDFDKVSQFTWSVRKCGNSFYAVHSNTDTYMHRVVKSGSIIDHINRNPLDNRKSNLRSSNYAQNSRNRTPKNKYLGVVKRKDCNRYSSFATIDGKTHYMGTFKTALEASVARESYLKEMGV